MALRMNTFRYYTGEEIQLGDKVIVNRHQKHVGYVREIEPPGSQQAMAINCPTGYVCTHYMVNGIEGSILWTPPDGENWEDLEFICRKQP